MKNPHKLAARLRTIATQIDRQADDIEKRFVFFDKQNTDALRSCASSLRKQAAGLKPKKGK